MIRSVLIIDNDLVTSKVIKMIFGYLQYQTYTTNHKMLQEVDVKQISE
jgi:hypothetical protein